MYQAKTGVKKFSLYGESPDKKNFFQSEHVSSQIWCQKILPLLGGGPLTKKKFFQSEHVSSQIWCQKIFTLLGGGPSTKIFFFQSEHVSSQIWCQKILPLLRLGPPLSPLPPPESVDRYTDRCQNITFPCTTYAGGNNG